VSESGGTSDHDLVELLKSSPEVHFKASMQIEDKGNRVIRPTPNILQHRISEAYEVLQELATEDENGNVAWNRGCNLLVLKPRQEGSSTFCTALVHHHVMKWKSNGVVMANLRKISAKLFRKLKTHFDMDQIEDEAGEIINVPARVFGVARCEIVNGICEYSNGSTMELDTAEQPKGGIGDTRQVALFSEVGRWPKTGIKNDEKTAQAILSSVAKEPRSLSIGESTPEGANGWFHGNYKGAQTLEEFLASLKEGKTPGVDPGHGNGWIKIFAAWHEFPLNVIPVSEETVAHIRNSLTEREKEGLAKYKWSWDQIAWRRYTIRQECHGDEDLFDQDYPEDDVRCWLVSGRPRFNMTMLAKMDAMTHSYNPRRGIMTEQDSGRVSFIETVHNEAHIEIFEEPREGMRYLVAVDPATGVDQTDSKDPDATAILVLRAPYIDQDGVRHRLKVVARVMPKFRLDADIGCKHVRNLSHYYGRCVVIVEQNMGLEYIRLLKMDGVPLYMRESEDPERPGVIKLVEGFKLKDRELKRSLVDRLASHIRDGLVEIPCPHVISECMAFITDKNGADRARDGDHDDDVMALAMGIYSIESATLYAHQVRKRRYPPDYRRWKRVGPSV
jgi:hypothetical protein